MRCRRGVPASGQDGEKALEPDGEKVGPTGPEGDHEFPLAGQDGGEGPVKFFSQGPHPSSHRAVAGGREINDTCVHRGTSRRLQEAECKPVPPYPPWATLKDSFRLSVDTGCKNTFSSLGAGSDAGSFSGRQDTPRTIGGPGWLPWRCCPQRCGGRPVVGGSSSSALVATEARDIEVRDLHYTKTSKRKVKEKCCGGRWCLRENYFTR